MTGTQAQPFSIDTLKAQQPGYQHELFTFPVIRMAGHAQVAHAIQRDLCMDFLDVDIDTLNGRPWFMEVWGDSAADMMPALNSLTWYCVSPRPALVTFELSGEWCGAYCEGFTTHYTYELVHGQRLEFDSLFTREGGAAVRDALFVRWQELLRSKIKEVEDTLHGTGLSPDMQDYSNEELELYEQCLAERSDPKVVYVEDMEPTEGVLRVRIARCSAHWNRNADELDPMWRELPYGWLSQYLRPMYRPLFGQ